MPATRISDESAVALAAALNCQTVIDRYLAKVVAVPGSECRLWSAAISGHGHGRFWICGNGRNQKSITVIAHRFGWGLIHGIDALLNAQVLTHTCDNPLCQTSEHLRARTNAENRAEWAARRHQIRNPLRDLRGAGGRAREVRDAINSGHSPDQIAALGVRQLDRDQLGFW